MRPRALLWNRLAVQYGIFPAKRKTPQVWPCSGGFDLEAKMIAVPWYLVSIGIFILLIGFVMAALRNPPYKKPMIDPKMSKEEVLDALENARDDVPMIDAKMSDEEIAEKLQGGRGDLLSNLVIFLGGLLIVIGLGWRMIRALRVFF